MNRTEFMQQLESLLQNIPQTEREEALQYYNDYFDDAGSESEQDVLDALGNPAKVAESIKRDQTINRTSGKAAGRGDSESDYRQEDAQGNSVKNPIVKTSDSQTGQEGQSAAASPKKGMFEDMPTWQIVLVVIAAVVLAPVALGVATSLLSTIVGIVAGWFALILGFGAAAFVLLVLLVVLMIAGIFTIVKGPWIAIGLIGGGLICGSLGILFLMLTVAMAGIATPAIFRGCKELWRSLTKKSEKEVAA